MGADLKSVRRVGFKQADLTRAVRGVEKAGFRVGRIEIGLDGKIILLPEGTHPGAVESANEWDSVLR